MSLSLRARQGNVPCGDTRLLWTRLLPPPRRGAVDSVRLLRSHKMESSGHAAAMEPKALAEPGTGGARGVWAPLLRGAGEGPREPSIAARGRIRGQGLLDGESGRLE